MLKRFFIFYKTFTSELCSSEGRRFEPPRNPAGLCVTELSEDAKGRFIGACLIIMLIPFMVLTVGARAVGLTNSPLGSDLIPPQITIIAPLRDSVVDSGAPLIELSVTDPGSDIDLSTMGLFLDRMNVTASATITQMEDPGQAMVRWYKISYQPSGPLKQGIHEIHLSVRDMAGNLAEIQWSFQVAVGSGWGIRVSGNGALQYNVLPISETTGLLDLTFQGQSQDIDVQLHLFGRATDHPAGSPQFNYENYNFYLDSYSLGIYHQRFSLVLGYTGVSLESELFQNNLNRGWVVGDTIEVSGGEYKWSIFSGDSASSSGLKIEISKINGAMGKWSSVTGWSLGGFWVSLEGEDGGVDFFDIRGNSPLGKPVLFRYEAIHGVSKDGDAGQRGNGIGLHVDLPMGASMIGLDYITFQPEYPGSGLTSGGLQRSTIRCATLFAGGHTLNVDGYFTVTNLDGSVAETQRQENVNVGYNWNPEPTFSFNANYQWGEFDRHTNETTSDVFDNQLMLGWKKIFKTASLQSSLSARNTWDPGLGQSSDQRLFSGAWNQPLGSYNLIPSFNWKTQNGVDGSKLETGEFRITVDRQLHPDVSRSSLAFFGRIGEDTESSAFDTGAAVVLYLKSGRNSNITISYNCTWWTKEDIEAGYSNGWNHGGSLTWKCYF